MSNAAHVSKPKFPGILETHTIEQLKTILQKDKFIQEQQKIEQHNMESKFL